MAPYLWIGGATDAGKTTVARRVALVHTLALYEYDRADRPHHERLAETVAVYSDFLQQSLDHRWVETTPTALFDRAMRSFEDRFGYVLDDMAVLARRGRPVLAEGFGLTPDLVAPHLDDSSRAIWLLPSEDFKRKSWERRDKPGFKHRVADPERGARNLFERDLMLSREIARQAEAHGFRTQVIDSALTEDALTSLIEDHFRRFFDHD